jgi:hypothetical protein
VFSLDNVLLINQLWVSLMRKRHTDFRRKVLEKRDLSVQIDVYDINNIKIDLK